jgi:uncharacterized protein (DUF1919 family)
VLVQQRSLLTGLAVKESSMANDAEGHPSVGVKKIYHRTRFCVDALRALVRRTRLRSTDFSIISNNCWGGFIYRYFGLPYTSPTIGLFIYPPDYVRFLENLHYYLALDVEFLTGDESKYTQAQPVTYPIGRLDDVELFFMHYRTPEDARESWNSRKQRINYDNLLVKFSERSPLCTPEIVERFAALDYPHKICFTMNKYDFDCCIHVPELEKVVAGGSETLYTLRHIDIHRAINSVTNGRLRAP